MKKLLFLLIFPFITGCSGQTTEKRPQKVKMEKFDVSKLKGFDTNSEINFTKGDTLYQIFYTNNQYSETKRKVGENFMRHGTYDEKTLSLVTEGTVFSHMPYGIYYEYDTVGNLVKEINLDEHFKFSIYNLITLIKNKYSVDINQFLNNYVLRGFDKNLGKYVYIVEHRIDEWKMRYIIVDGRTGKVISDDYKYYGN